MTYPLTWMEYVHRHGTAPPGVNPPGFRPCQHCGLPMVWQKLDDPVIGTRWEWRTPVFGDVHRCEELQKHLEDYDAE